MEKNKYLVTGAAGFIGSAIAKKLIKDGNEVWTIDNLSTGLKSNLPEGIVFINGNCQDNNSIKMLNNTCFNAILHFAGQSSGEISFDDPVYDLHTNVDATLKLIEYALNNDCKRFIYASSMSVYGDVSDKPINENNKCVPLSFYGVGKLASEHYLRIYESRGIISTSLRLFNVYGPGQNLINDRQGMVSIFLAQSIKGDDIIVKGDGGRFRDFIYIDDVVDITVNLINNDKTFGQIINIANGQKIRVNDILDKINKLFSYNKKIKYVGKTPGDQYGIFADTTLADKILLRNCKTNIDKGIKKMFNWAISLKG